MKRYFSLLLVSLSLALIVFTPAMTCANFNSTVIKTEKLATDSAYAAFKGWVAYYKASTNGATAEKIDRLNLSTATVNNNVKSFALSVYVLDTLRESALTNAGNKGAVTVALEAVNQNSSNIVWLVNHFQTQP